MKTKDLSEELLLLHFTLFSKSLALTSKFVRFVSGNEYERYISHLYTLRVTVLRQLSLITPYWV